MSFVGVVLDCSSESSPEGRYIISILGLIVFRSAIEVLPSWCSVSPRLLKTSLAVVRVEHVEPHSSLLGIKDLIDHVKELLEVKTVLLLDLKHGNEHVGYFFPELFLNPLQFFEEGVESDLKVLIVINI